MSGARALYISPIGMRENNGMMQRQQQTLAILSQIYCGSLDILSLGAGAQSVREWLKECGIAARVLEGWYPLVARVNALLWYLTGVVLCNRLHWSKHFRFPVRTALPSKWISRYNVILCYYPWPHRLLSLSRAGAKVIVDLGDVMADRHQRIGVRRWISLDPDDERAVLKSQSRCIAISNDDAQEFQKLYGVRLPLVPFAPRISSQLAALASADRPSRIGFMGAPSYQNEEILRLLSSPTFLASLAREGIELVVAGGICDSIEEPILKALRQGGTKVIGRIKSLPEYYSQVAATVNPVGPSTGVKIKSIETLIAGRSLITTRWGADSMLSEQFPRQVSYIDWPVSADELAAITIKTVRAAAQGDPAAARLYAENASTALRAIVCQ